MKLTFCIHYETQPGEELCVNVCQKNGTVKQYRMLSTDNYTWSIPVEALLTTGQEIEYFYSVYRQTTELRREWNVKKHLLIIDCPED